VVRVVGGIAVDADVGAYSDDSGGRGVIVVRSHFAVVAPDKRTRSRLLYRVQGEHEGTAVGEGQYLRISVEACWFVKKPQKKCCKSIVRFFDFHYNIIMDNDPYTIYLQAVLYL
jgi:hypothetical protein